MAKVTTKIQEMTQALYAHMNNKTINKTKHCNQKYCDGKIKILKLKKIK
jgi:hypothetical protein